jgi:L-threonylcarbamoyladenylate synthase
MMKTRVLKASLASTRECVQLLQKGYPVALPTETVYGLAANGLDESALRKIFEVKGRPLIDPLILHFKSLTHVKEHAQDNHLLSKLAKLFWPGPLTLIVAKKTSIPDLATAGMKSVAVRVPSNTVFRSILETIDFPLAAPSANPFGYISPTTAEHVLSTLGNRIHLILDDGPTNYGVESTILDIRNPLKPTILRHGPILIEDLERCLGVTILDPKTDGDNQFENQVAPGQLKQHYSPHTALSLLPYGTWKRGINLKLSAGPEKIALVYTRKPKVICDQTYWLSEVGNMDEIARNLFSTLHKLDAMKLDKVYIELPSKNGFGAAINDRLQRAAAKSMQ